MVLYMNRQLIVCHVSTDKTVSRPRMRLLKTAGNGTENERLFVKCIVG